jgi:hypothetical protein
MAIVMPATRKLKEQRNMTRCLANLGQWNPVISNYVEDNDGKFFSGYGDDSSWWIAQLEDRHQSRLKNKLWFCPKTTEPLYDEHHDRTDTFNIFQAWGIYTTDFRGHDDLSPDGIAGSYGLNGYVLSNAAPTDETSTDGTPQNNFWATPPARGAANVPLLVEALHFDVRPQEHEGPASVELAAWSGNHMARTSINRHVGFESVSFCDFSARKVGLKELWALKWHRRFNTAGPWTKAGGVEASNWPQWIRPLKDY